MATEYQRYIVQSEHNLKMMKVLLHGRHENEEPGLIDFHSQMIDLYLRWYEDAEERRTRVYGDSKFAEFIKNRKLDFYEVCSLFVYKDSHLYCSAKRLAEGYERLMEEAEKLNPKKKKAVYGVVGKKKSEIYKDMTWDLDGFCYRNDRFLKYLNAMAELITRRPQRNDMPCSGNIIIPLTEEQQNKLDSIEKEFYEMLQVYNESIIGEREGVKSLYKAISKLVKEKLPKAAKLDWDERETTFPDKAYVIPKKYVRKKEFNPYEYVSKRKSPEDLIRDSNGDIMFY